MRLKEHQPLLHVTQESRLQLGCSQNSQELIYVITCISKWCEQEKTSKDRENKVSGLLNSSNPIEKSKVWSKNVVHMIFVGLSSRFAQYGLKEGWDPLRSPRDLWNARTWEGKGSKADEVGVKSSGSVQMEWMSLMLGAALPITTLPQSSSKEAPQDMTRANKFLSTDQVNHLL